MPIENTPEHEKPISEKKEEKKEQREKWEKTNQQRSFEEINKFLEKNPKLADHDVILKTIVARYPTVVRDIQYDEANKKISMAYYDVKNDQIIEETYDEENLGGKPVVSIRKPQEELPDLEEWFDKGKPGQKEKKNIKKIKKETKKELKELKKEINKQDFTPSEKMDMGKPNPWSFNRKNKPMWTPGESQEGSSSGNDAGGADDEGQGNVWAGG